MNMNMMSQEKVDALLSEKQELFRKLATPFMNHSRMETVYDRLTEINGALDKNTNLQALA